jgi:type IX secretion system PorP/SprF family membrane protein
MKKLSVFLFACITGISCLLGQDPQFSQFYAAPLYLSPSMAGSSNQGRVNLNYRDQWPAISGHFTTYAVSIDQFLPEFKSGIGLRLMHDNAGGGKLTSTTAGFNYSYRIKLARNLFMQPGLQTYYYQRKINYGRLTFTDQFYGDMVLPTSIEEANDLNKGYMDFTSSVLLFSDLAWFGFTLDHMMKLNGALADDPRYVPLMYSFFGGVTFKIFESILSREDQLLSIAYHFKRQNKINQLDLGAYYFRDFYRLGLWYRGLPGNSGPRGGDALIFLGGLVFNNFSINYSYDLTISNMIQSTGGAHEISMVFGFEGLARKHKMGMVPCPRF